MKEQSIYQPGNVQVVLKNPFNSRQTIVELWHTPIGQYTVRAGADSDFSYTGFIPNVADMNQMNIAIIERYNSCKVFR